MILIGGVGVPLETLPEWAKVAASFMPGRYAVDLLQGCYLTAPQPFSAALFPLLALSGIGATSLLAGLKLLRWDKSARLSMQSISWLIIALFAWILVGTCTLVSDRVNSSIKHNPQYLLADITDESLSSIDFVTLPEDNGFYTPLAPPLGETRLTHRMQELKPRLRSWKPAKLEDQPQAIMNLLCVAANADIVQDRSEATIARLVFDELQFQFPPETLQQILTWIILNPDACNVITLAPELGLSVEVAPDIARERCNWYARKFLGRLTGAIPENSE